MKQISLMLILLLVLVGCSGNSNVPEDEVRAAIEQLDQDIGAMRDKLPENWSISSAQLAPSPENISPYGLAAGAEEVWCIVIDPPARIDVGWGIIVVRSFLVWRVGLLWRAGSWSNMRYSIHDTFLEVGCTNFADEEVDR